jgi:hypothetical protein
VSVEQAVEGDLKGTAQKIVGETIATFSTLDVETTDRETTALARIDARAVDLANEADPRTANETIADWEKMLALPDDRVLVIAAAAVVRRIPAKIGADQIVMRGQQATAPMPPRPAVMARNTRATVGVVPAAAAAKPPPPRPSAD